LPSLEAAATPNTRPR